MPIVSTDIKKYESKSTAAADGEASGDGLGGYRSSDEIVTDTDENLFDNVTAAESENGDTEYRAFFIKNTHATLTFTNAKVYISPTGTLPFTHLDTQLESGGSETTVTVDAAADFPASGAFFIEDEEITYTGKTSTSFTGCTRGANGTSKELHAVDTKIEHNQIRMAVEEPSNKTTGSVQTIADESTAPTGLSFTSNYTFATGISIGSLAPGEFYGVWWRRKIPAGCKAKTGISYTLAVKGETEE